MSCHNQLCDGVSNLVQKSLTTTHMCDYPLFNPGHAVQSRKGLLAKSNPPNTPTETAIDLE